MATRPLNASHSRDKSLDTEITSYTSSTLFTAVSVPNGEKVMLNDEDLAYIVMINNWGLGQCVTILGVIVNVLSIMTFIKQGVKDSVNISLLGLTISDLGSLVFLLFNNMCWIPSVLRLDLPFYPTQILYYFAWGHILFTRITIGTTAWIMFERCVCIVAPLSIKSIVTSRRTVTFITGLYVLMTASIAPIFYIARPTWTFDVGRNKSVLGITKIKDKATIEGFVYWGNNLIPTALFILIVIFTLVLIVTLRKNSQWRQQTTLLSKGNVMSNRDTKICKLVLIISLVFIFCYLPGAVVFLILLAFPSINFNRKQRNVMIAIFSCLFHLECINASVNFFIYLSMSSKFKVAFQELFLLRKVEEKTGKKTCKN